MMFHTKLIHVRFNLVVAGACPECGNFQTINDQLVLFYWCDKCNKPFMPYKTPFTAYRKE